jgi:integrase
MAAFGLRPHEAFFADLLQSNGHWSCHVTQGKTGDRTVLTAFPPDWVNLFDLPNKVLPNIEYQQAYAHGKLGERIAAQFRRYKVPFTAYSLRHAYAIRGALPPYNVSIVVMAAMMGHSPQVHLNTYQKHISSTQHQAAIDAALNQ